MSAIDTLMAQIYRELFDLNNSAILSFRAKLGPVELCLTPNSRNTEMLATSTSIKQSSEML